MWLLRLSKSESPKGVPSRNFNIASSIVNDLSTLIEISCILATERVIITAPSANISQPSAVCWKTDTHGSKKQLLHQLQQQWGAEIES